MKSTSVKVFLKTMAEYNTVTINLSFTAENGYELNVRCLPGTTTFEITDSFKQKVVLHHSLETATAYIVAFMATVEN